MLTRTAIRRLALAGVLALVSPLALAQDDPDPFLSDDDDLIFGDDVDVPEAPEAPASPDTFEDPDDELDFEDPLDPLDGGLLEDEPEVPPGGDTAATYRMTLDQAARLDTDEELQLWDAYLEKYPNSSFRGQIEDRRRELEDALYEVSGPGDRPDPDAPSARAAEVHLAHGVLLENMNPRDRLLVLVEWGLPSYASLAVDYEREIVDRLSVHAGLRRRFTGLSVETGARYAFVRSPRTGAIVTGMLDARFNAAPAFFALRPMLAAGKRFGKLDLQGQAGVELAPRGDLDLRVIGGLNGTYRASDAIGLFAETSLYMHTLSGDAGPYRFNQFVFGTRFLPDQKRERPEDIEVVLAATLPYTSAYWQFHFGSIVAQLVLAL